MDQMRIAQQLSSTLSLREPPVGLTFADSVPVGVPIFNEVVPSSCALWRKAEKGVFFAPAESHYNCPVGAMVMGFDMPESVKSELMGAVGLMCECGYVSPDEPEKIPTIKRQSKGIVYGPLAELPVQADLILLWLTPQKAMYFNEAIGASKWTHDAPTSVFGRPGCSALPVALENGRTTASFGCMGMRTFTEIPDDRFLVTVPAARVEEFAQSLEKTAAVNEGMRTYYLDRKARFSG